MNHWKKLFTDHRPRPCRAPFWARGGHAQTILGHLLPAPEDERQPEPFIIPLTDGDRLAADYYAGTCKVILYLFHGLGEPVCVGT